MKTNNNTTDSTLINSAVILLAILLVMLSFQVNAQAINGCTDPIGLNYYQNPSAVEDGSCIYADVSQHNTGGWATTAVCQITSPSIHIFNFNKVVLKYREVGTSAWTKIVFPLTPLAVGVPKGGLIDTLNLSLWYSQSIQLDMFGQIIPDGARHFINLRINALENNTQYQTKMWLKGTDVMTGLNRTLKLNSSFYTEMDGYPEAPFPLWAGEFMADTYTTAPPQARVGQATYGDQEIVRSNNLNGQAVDSNTSGVIIHTLSDGSTVKVLNR